MRLSRLVPCLLLLLLPAIGFAQAETTGSNLAEYTLIGIVVALLITVVIMVGNSFLSVEAVQTGAASTGQNFSIIPSRDEIFSKKLPPNVDKKNVTFLRQGFDVNLLGEAENIVEPANGTRFGIQPPNFIGMSPIPKLEVEVGSQVKAGDVLFYDKKRPEIKYCAPVSGEVIEINRGEKRLVANVVLLADKEIAFAKHEVPSLNGDRQGVVDFMLANGAWPMLRQRPFNVVPDPLDVPKAIFVTTFDTAPLAPDLNVVIDGQEAAFQRGLDVLNALTPGKVHLGLDARAGSAPSTAFSNAAGVEKHYFRGKHPAGNVGVHVHHIDPVGSDQVVYTAGVQEVITIGRLFTHGQFDTRRTVALVGDELEQPMYLQTYLGASVADLIKGRLKETENDIRLISGDVLSGAQTQPDGFLDFYDDQLTVIEEGNYYELFGWLLPILPRPSRSGTYPNALLGDYRFKANTNSHGERRAFVVTGEYEAVLPMDVLPQHLMKAIMANDFERMEGLGIYELVEEDVALCEFACTSKQPLQRILRDGLEVMRAQG